MNPIEKLTAIEEIKQAKANYFRGVDTGDTELVRGILADDCELDYNGCCTDPATKKDFMPAMNVIVRGSTAWQSGGFQAQGIASVHQGHNCEVIFTSDSSARVIWSMTDRLFMPTGAPFSVMTGYGYYHETYVKSDDTWKIKTLRIERIRVEVK